MNEEFGTMELEGLLENSSVSLITAFLLGLQTAVCPCPMVTNITAVGYIGRDLNNKHRVFINGIFYAVGGLLAYSLLAFILVPLIREGIGIYMIQKIISRISNYFIPLFFVAFGLFLLFGEKLNLPSISLPSNEKKMKERAKKGWLGALFLGIVLALAFCPTTALIYFGMLLPMSVAENTWIILPVVYAVAASMPVVVLAWVIAYSMAGLGRFYNKVQVFERWYKLVVALLFIVIGIYEGINLFL